MVPSVSAKGGRHWAQVPAPSIRLIEVDMKVQGLTCAFLTAAALFGACGRIGYDADGAPGPASGGTGLVGTLAGGTLGGTTSSATAATVGSGGTLGSGGDASRPPDGGVGGAGGSIATGGSTAAGGSAGTGGVGGTSDDAGIIGSPGGSGGSSGGAGGQGGSTVGSGICTDVAPFKLIYRHYSDTPGQINLGFKVSNGSGAPLPLRDTKVRYFFTNEVASFLYTIQYGDICCPDTSILSHVSATVVPMSPPSPTADTYVEVTFDSGAGFLDTGHTVEVEVQLRSSDLFTQTNDYSFIAAASGTQQQWDACPGAGNCTNYHSCLMTVLVSNELVWGFPP